MTDRLDVDGLALAHAARALHRIADAVHEIDLGSAREPSALPVAVATTETRLTVHLRAALTAYSHRLEVLASTVEFCAADYGRTDAGLTAEAEHQATGQ